MSPTATRPFIASALFAALAAALPGGARAETYQTCTGFITSVPAVIGTQGVWCLRQNLATAIGTGNAITITANNVTLDCNHMKIGGLSAGPGTQATGIRADDRTNVTIRNCNLRGFYDGVALLGAGSGHLVEDNRLGGTTHFGIQVSGEGSVVRRNEVVDPGGSSVAGDAYAIKTNGTVDIIGNSISGVTGSAGFDGYAVGIYTDNNLGGRIHDNGVRNLIASGGAVPLGIYNLNNLGLSIRDNDLNAGPSPAGTGIHCTDATTSVRGNNLVGFALAFEGFPGCNDDGGNTARN